MTDKIMAVFGLLGLIAFLIVLPIFVPRVDLVILTIGCVGLAAFDFWRELFARRH